MNEVRAGGFEPGERVLLVGAAGMGMVPLGLILCEKGCRVIAYDDAMSLEVRALYDAAGVFVWDGFGSLPPVDRMVCSSAIGPEHPLREIAAGSGCPVCLRGEALAHLTRGRKLVAVVGSHGKTTTTAMLVDLLRKEGHRAGYFIGGLPTDGSAPGSWGTDPWFVAEVDESDGTIDQFHPFCTLWLNFDPDHVARYADEASLRQAFQGLVHRTRCLALIPEGETIVPAPPGVEVRSLGWGLASADELSIPDYNARNLHAAASVAREILGRNPILPTAKRVPLVRRRQTVLFASTETVVREDYAHHPTEIDEFLRGERNLYPDHGTVLVFQPHRYSRTRQHAAGFAANLRAADRSLLLPVYGAGEDPRDGAGSEAILRHLESTPTDVTMVPGLAEGLRWLIEDRRVNTGRRLYAVVGAGSVERLGRAWAAWLDTGGDEVEAWRKTVEGRLGPATRLRLNVPLAAKTTIRVGGLARAYAEPATVDDLRMLLQAATIWGWDSFVIGRGSNLLFPDEGFPGLVLRLGQPFWRGWVRREDGLLEVGPGLRMQEMAQRSAALGLTGFEFAEGIPGSVGGSLRMNAGAMGDWILDRLVWVETMDKEGTRRRWKRDSLTPVYRGCPELEGQIVLRAAFEPVGTEPPDRIRERMAGYARRRRATQPSDRSAGCAFKNPDGDSAGRLIEAAGLKGFAIGGASVSTVHANFIVNDGTASAADVAAVMRHVAKEVERRHGVRLEPEVIVPKPFSIDTPTLRK